MFRRLLPHIRFTVFTRDPLWTSVRYAVDAVRTPTFPRGVTPEVVSALRSADGLVISGGGNICSTWPEKVEERLALMRTARRSRPTRRDCRPDARAPSERRPGCIARRRAAVGPMGWRPRRRVSRTGAVARRSCRSHQSSIGRRVLSRATASRGRACRPAPCRVTPVDSRDPRRFVRRRGAPACASRHCRTARLARGVDECGASIRAPRWRCGCPGHPLRHGGRTRAARVSARDAAHPGSVAAPRGALAGRTGSDDRIHPGTTHSCSQPRRALPPSGFIRTSTHESSCEARSRARASSVGVCPWRTPSADDSCRWLSRCGTSAERCRPGWPPSTPTRGGVNSNDGLGFVRPCTSCP